MLFSFRVFLTEAIAEWKNVSRKVTKQSFVTSHYKLQIKSESKVILKDGNDLT